MNYFIKRDDKEYGPYSLADLQKYVASGNVLLTDLCRSEGLMDWVPVSQVIGNIPVSVAATQPAAMTSADPDATSLRLMSPSSSCRAVRQARRRWAIVSPSCSSTTRGNTTR